MAAQTHLMIADIRPPIAFGDLDLHSRNGLLTGTDVHQSRCSNYGRNLMDPTVIVIHFTAGPGTAQRSINAMNERNVSAHMVVDRRGMIWQCVPLTHVAYHAGAGDWNGYHNNMNVHSIGIETCNLGPLWRAKNQRLVDSYGIERTGFATQRGVHRNAKFLDLKKLLGEAAYNRIVKKGVEKPDLANCEWEIYPIEQQKALQRLCSFLVTRFPTVRAIIGHDDYAPRRKIDPGPVLGLESLVGWLPEGRVILYQDDHRRPGYTSSLDSPDYMRNLVISRTFGAGNIGRDIG